MGKRLFLDVLMALLLLSLMAYALIGEDVHEVLGMFFFLLLFCHQWNNRGWYRGVWKGSYGSKRVLSTVINSFLLIALLLQIISGVLLSKHLFAFAEIGLDLGALRLLHLALPYWFFLLASLHLGLHGKMLAAWLGQKFTFLVGASGKWWRIFGCIISCYGLYALFSRRFPDYMLLWDEYAFFDFAEPLAFFLGDYAAIMILGMVLGIFLESHILCKGKE